MASSPDIELIAMEVPGDRDHQIYIRRILWRGIKEHLEHEMEKIFSAFGLIHNIVIRSAAEESDEWYSYVTFYSVRAATLAVQENGKLIFEGQRLKIMYSPFPRPKQLERELEPAEPNTVQYLCLVRVKMPKEGLCSEGLGLSSVPCNMSSPVSRGSAFSCSQKFAMHAAMKSAFSKYIIIVMSNGKVTVEVDTTKQEPLIYDPAWDKPVVKVKDIFYNPEDEEECEDLDDMTEEQLEEILNQPI
ncbi:RAD52 motif-containing protein 1-like isoform X3 [Macrobrachium rosenbergii]|uniref:RAD52 motif-containing protein 1-like isoform X3 n=1 Tax=Macrobrachium rosenbergii TaxID=79674 RepID=UPI0034D6414A